MADAKPLNIGAGQTRIPGWINIDIDTKAELVLDLSTDQLPFGDSSVPLIFSYHTLEHIPDYLHALGEMWRVLEHNGTLLLGLPYCTLTRYHAVNPYHLHNFNEHSFAFFDPDRLKGSAEEDNPITFKEAWLRYHYLRPWRYLPLKNAARRSLLNVVRMIDIGLVAVKNDTPVELGDNRERQMRQQFDQCMAARVPYRQAAAVT